MLLIIGLLVKRIDAEARVLKLEKELKEAKNVEKQLCLAPQRSVGDIKRVTNCLKGCILH
jgi:hypothetical protein